jgi:hypothetical protein
MKALALPIFLSGVILAITSEKTGNIIRSSIQHMAINFLLLYLHPLLIPR